jgi:hypothetical protein
MPVRLFCAIGVIKAIAQACAFCSPIRNLLLGVIIARASNEGCTLTRKIPKREGVSGCFTEALIRPSFCLGIRQVR